jgi:predicted RNA methylase
MKTSDGKENPVIGRRVDTDIGEGRVIDYNPPFGLRVKYDLTGLEKSYDIDDVIFLD